MKQAKKNKSIIIIPSIADPRSTVASIAQFQNAFNIEPPMPIVVVYGACPIAHKARGEGGRKVEDWPPPWDNARFRNYRERFKAIADNFGVPVYFFDDATQARLWDFLCEEVDKGKFKPPRGIGPEDMRDCIEEIFGATYSYGAQRNKAFIVANNLSARSVFFFDDDTYLAPHVGNILARHLDLLSRKNVNAVTGGYFGQRAFNASIFRKIDQQQEFMGLLGYEIPDDQATQDLWGWRIADGVLGGNFCLKRHVYKRVCCPAMHRCPTTDDKLVGREIRRIFGRQSHVYKTGWPVIHIHFPNRIDPRQVLPYLESWAKTKAFWALYDKTNGVSALGDEGKRDERTQLLSETKHVVDEFGKSLLGLAETEQQKASGEIANAIYEASQDIIGRSASIVDVVHRDLERFHTLQKCWKQILDKTETYRMWNKGNHFLPASE
jgi:hypothetical protein